MNPNIRSRTHFLKISINYIINYHAYRIIYYIKRRQTKEKGCALAAVSAGCCGENRTTPSSANHPHHHFVCGGGGHGSRTAVGVCERRHPTPATRHPPPHSAPRARPAMMMMMMMKLNEYEWNAFFFSYCKLLTLLSLIIDGILIF